MFFTTFFFFPSCFIFVCKKAARFKIVPLIFPRKNFNLNRALGMLNYSLEVFNGKPAYVEEKKHFYNSLVLEFKEKICRWKDFKPIRSIIEDIFKLAKNSFVFSKLHHYTMRSVEKRCAFCVFLTGVAISLEINSKKTCRDLLNDDSSNDPKLQRRKWYISSLNIVFSHRFVSSCVHNTFFTHAASSWSLILPSSIPALCFFLSEPAFVSVLLEPFYFFLVIGYRFFDQSPEIFGVVEFNQMG
ncbi:hypothetical protein IPdc08_01302 [archaeon]|nr:hypothetical protein IPdc08_01302 [archaeon]